MNALASSPTAPFHLANQHWTLSMSPDAMSSNPWSRTELAVQYDERGRLQPFVETAEQRRARIAFLRKGKLSKRISEWLEESSGVNPEVRIPYLKADPRAADNGASPFFVSQQMLIDQRSLHTPSRRSSSSSLRTIDEEDETEPEVIYATPAPTRWTAVSPTLFPPRPPVHHTRTNSFSSLNSSRTSSSLSSISEED